MSAAGIEWSGVLQGVFTPVASPAAKGRVARRNHSFGTPEIYFTKHLDNSRLVKAADPERAREMAMFTGAVACLFMLVMFYAWQHFSAIEYGYQIEAMNRQKEQLVEANRALRLEEASLRDPERIDVLARQMGLQSPQAGQIVRMDSAPETSAPVMARMADVSVLPVAQ